MRKEEEKDEHHYWFSFQAYDQFKDRTVLLLSREKVFNEETIQKLIEDLQQLLKEVGD
jgi:hypothetical protein